MSEKDLFRQSGSVSVLSVAAVLFLSPYVALAFSGDACFGW